MDLKCSGVSPRSALHRSKKRGATAAALKIAVLCGLTLSVASGCGDDFTGAEVVCHKGDTRECLGPGACKGAQECTATGSGFQPCQCSDGATQGGNGGQGSEPAHGIAGASLGGNPAIASGGETADGGTTAITVAGASGNVGDAGAGGTREPVSDCSPIGNVGCSASQNCSLDDGKPRCVSAGTKAELATCSQTKECGPGLFCQFGNCIRACSETADCSASGAAHQCGPGKSYPALPAPLVGSCARTCDPLAQDCPSGLACYLGSCLRPVAARAQGAQCDWSTQCGEGLDCLLDLDLDGHPDCNKYCSTTAPSPCGQGFVCYPVQESFPSVPASWGTCYPQ